MEPKPWNGGGGGEDVVLSHKMSASKHCQPNFYACLLAAHHHHVAPLVRLWRNPGPKPWFEWLAYLGKYAKVGLGNDVLTLWHAHE